jgi:predicted MPP superfamily phosphohydrolase
LKQLHPRYGVYAVTGNHEFYTGVERFMLMAKASNITVLRNRKISVGGIEIAGIDDQSGSDISTYRQNAQKVLASIDPDKVSVFLTHQPNFYKEAAKQKVNLELAAHTHNGQIPPFNVLVRLEYKYPYGLHEFEDTFIYTTSGTGVWGPPMRLFSQSEIVLFELAGKN